MASTCKFYTAGLQDEVRRAKKECTALVPWPSSGMVVELTRNLDVRSGLVNGALFIVSRVIGERVLLDHVLVHARATAVVPRDLLSAPRPRCRFGFPYVARSRVYSRVPERA